LKIRSKTIFPKSGAKVDVLGVGFIEDKSGVRALHQTISEIGNKLHGKCIFTLIPDGATHGMTPTLTIEGHSFAEWTKVISDDSILDQNVEEVLILISPTFDEIANRSPKKLFSLDPYAWAKELPSIGDFVVIFFSSWHKNIEIYLPSILNQEIRAILLKNFAGND